MWNILAKRRILKEDRAFSLVHQDFSQQQQKSRSYLETSEILKVTSNFDICSYVQIYKNLGIFVSYKMCYILGNQPSILEKF